MLWLRRSIVLTPIAAFVAAALLLSCGGGGGGSTSSNPNPFSITSLAICPGSPPTKTPTPKPTQYKCATPTPVKHTPQCIPLETVTSVPTAAPSGAPTVDNGIQINVQQTIQQSKNSKKRFNDVTGSGSLSWNIAPAGIIQPPLPSPYPPGEFFGLTAGCVCVSAQIGSVESCPVTIAVGGASCTPCPTPSPFTECPGPTPTPTKTPSKTKACAPTPTATATPIP